MIPEEALSHKSNSNGSSITFHFFHARVCRLQRCPCSVLFTPVNTSKTRNSRAIDTHGSVGTRISAGFSERVRV